LLASTALIAGASLGLGASAARAQSATWAGPGADWDTTANWSPAGVPTATAIFTGATPTSITFSAAATTINTIQFNAGAPAYTFTFDFANTFNVTGTGVNNNSSNAPTFTGTGVSSGTINFENSSTAGNANFHISEGLLSFQNNSNAGTATIANTVGGNAQFLGTIDFLDQSSANNANITIVGSTGLTGQLNFLDQSTAGNATITNNPGLGSGGVTQFGTLGGTDTADAGAAHITNNNMGVTDFLASTSAKNATIENAFNGNTNFEDQATAGNAQIINDAGGTTTFVAQSSAGNAGITNLGFLEFGFSGLYPIIIDTATAGNANITNIAGGMLTFNSATTAGNAQIFNSSNVFFFDVATAGSANIGNAGNITFFDNSTAGSATITTDSPGKVIFTDGATGGSAQFITNAGGTFDMSGLTSAGMTAGSIAGAGNYFLGAKQLTVGGNNLSTTVSGAIANGGSSGGAGGSLVKVGTGTLTLTGTDSFTGGTLINGGTLELDGTSASEVAVNSGGAFSGDGVVDFLGRSFSATVTIDSGGVFAPGRPGQPGTFMTIDGSLAFQSGAIYLVQLNPSSTTYVMVNGAVTLAGTVAAFFAPGSYIVPKTYEILQSFDRTGTFSGVVTVPPNFQANLTYDPRNVFLNLTAILGLGGNLTVNQSNVATALNNFFNNGGTLPPNFATVFGLAGPALANALNQIDGEASVDAEATAFKSMDQFLSLMLDPFVDGRTGSPGGGALGFAPDQPASFPPDIALAYDSVLKAPPPSHPSPASGGGSGWGFDQRWTAWGAAYGGSSNTNGDPAVIGSTSFTAQTYGFAAGMDRHISPDLVAGFALAGGGTHWDLAQAMGGGRSDAFQVGAYATKYFGPAYVAADIAFANHWMTTSRTAFAGDQLTANFNAQSYGGRIEAGYRYALPATWSVTPYGALQVQNFHTPQYSETDLTGGGFGLTYNAMSAYDTRGELGARFDEPTTLYGMPLTLRARLAWAHDWVDGPALQAVFETLPGANFIVNGAAVAKNSALTTAGAELHLTQAWSLLTKFDGEFAKGSQTYAGTGTLRYVW